MGYRSFYLGMDPDFDGEVHSSGVLYGLIAYWA